MHFDNDLIRRLRDAQRLVFFTGAGISRESGIPTFREGANKIWGDFDPELYASQRGFDAHPAKVWQWYSELRRQNQALQPNAAHHVVAAWQKKAKSVSVITQNIDGFHQRAGSREVIELHGNIGMDKCVRHSHQVMHDFDTKNTEPPQCEHCNSMLRPDIVWFDENLPMDAFNLAEEQSFNCDVFVCIGCSMKVYPAASMPVNAARCGAYLVQINPQKTLLDKIANRNLHGNAGEVLPALWYAVWGSEWK